MNAKISIAMATYNGEMYLHDQFDSILAQSFTDWELVVCDDCSTDKTVEILNEYAQKDSRIKVYKNEQNLGFKKNFEKAMNLCSCEYIALSDQDDVWTENHLQILLDNIGTKDLISGNAKLVDSELNDLGTDLFSTQKYEIIPDNKEDWFFFLMHGNIFQGAAMLFKKNLLNKALPIPENVKFHDYWLALLASLENGVAYEKIPVLLYRQHGTNVTKNEKWKLLNKINDAFFTNKKQKKIELQTTILTALEDRVPNPEIQKSISNAKKYFLSLDGIKRFSVVSYFVKNYKRIYLNNSKKLFALRFIKSIALGI